MAPDDFVSPPPDVPDAPAADWPQPYDPPLTPNLDDLGYYDPSWGQLYGYDPTDWYNYDLSGYNQYGFDFLGFDRWGYDRWGYDRWGYDRWGYNWAGYNWAGYDRNGWDRDGRNEWGQRRDHPGDPRNQDWYNRHHPYEQYYQWKFQNDDPVYHRTQWDQAHGFNPNLYQNWNMSRDWHDPRNRDWAPLATASTTTKSVTDVDIHASSPVVNLNASLAQFISNDKATSNSGSLMKDLADKSARDFTNELTPRTTISIGSPPAVDAWEATRHARSKPPNILCTTGIDGARADHAAVEGVTRVYRTQAFAGARLHTADGRPTAEKAGAHTGQHCAGKGPQSLLGANGDPAEGRLAEPRRGAAGRADTREPTQYCGGSSPRALGTSQTNPGPQAPESEPRARPAIPTQQEPPQQRSAPEPPEQDTPAPETQARAPEAPVRQAPVHQTPPPRAPPPSTSSTGARSRSGAARPTGTARARGAASCPASCSCATSGTRTKGTQVFNSDVLMGFQHLLR